MNGRTSLLALAVAMLNLGLARHAAADPSAPPAASAPAADDRDRATVAHSRERSTVRTRFGSAPDSAPAVVSAAQDPQLLCDRTCLQGLADDYLKAVLAHDPKLLSFDDHVRFTENGQELLPGDGFWNTASGVGAAQQFYADPLTQQITFVGTMREFDNLVLMAMRLKVRDRHISEVETLFYRKGAGPAWSDAGVADAGAAGAARYARAADGDRAQLDDHPGPLRWQDQCAAQR